MDPERTVHKGDSPLTSPSMEALAHDLHSALEESTSNAFVLTVDRNLKAADDNDDEDSLDFGSRGCPHSGPMAGAVPKPAASSSHHHRRRSWRRRCKSTSNLAALAATANCNANNPTDESSTDTNDEAEMQKPALTRKAQPTLPSKAGTEMGTSSLHFSDSDESGGHQQQLVDAGTEQQQASATLRKKKCVGTRVKHIESDSVNEGLTPLRPSTKRKRKFKRMALDPSPCHTSADSFSMARHSVSLSSTSSAGPSKRHKAKAFSAPFRPQQQQVGIVIGKRKRSNREKSMEPEHMLNSSKAASSSTFMSMRFLNYKKNDMDMECDDDPNQSSSSLSTSDWDGQDSDTLESFNNGREADDEQSDWPGHEPSVLTEDDEHPDIDMDVFSNFPDGIASPQIDPTMPLTATAKQAYLARMKRLAECVPGREIRAGTRKLHTRQPGFTIKSSSSEQLSRFLQDPSRSELRLTVLRSPDRNKIIHLANLYSLSVRSEEGKSNLLILSKTGRTVRLTEFAVPGNPNHYPPTEFKRRRRTPPISPLLEGSSTSNEPPDGYRTGSGCQISASSVIEASVDMSTIGDYDDSTTCDGGMGVAAASSGTPRALGRSESPTLGTPTKGAIRESGKASYGGSVSN